MQIPDNLGGEITSSSKQPKDSMQANFTSIARLLAKNDILVPSILSESTSPDFLIIDDLGETTLEKFVKQSSEQQISHSYECAVKILTQFQSRLFPMPKETVSCESGLDPTTYPLQPICYRRQYEAKLLMAELDHFTEWLVNEGLDHHFSNDETAVLDNLFQEIVTDICKQPKTLIHRDYQSRNIMLSPRSLDLVLIDFQDAMIGPCVYDLVALLQDSYIELSPSQIENLMHAFYDNTTHFNSYEDFETAFWTQTVQRKLKDAGRFVYIDRKRNDPSFLTHIPRSIRCVQRALTHLSGKGVSWADSLNTMLLPIFNQAISHYKA